MFENTPRSIEMRREILLRHASATMTDDERARLFGLPEGCRIRESAKIISIENFKCGHHVWIGENVVLDASGGLEIGNFTQIGVAVLVWTHSSHLQALASETCISSESIIKKPVKIGSNCWIVGPTVISPGITIGDRVQVLPMSVVTKDIASGSVVRGSPIEKLERLEERITQLERTIEDHLCLKTNAYSSPAERDS